MTPRLRQPRTCSGFRVIRMVKSPASSSAISLLLASIFSGVSRGGGEAQAIDRATNPARQVVGRVTRIRGRFPTPCNLIRAKGAQRPRYIRFDIEGQGTSAALRVR